MTGLTADNKRIRVLMVEHHSPGNRYVLELARELKSMCDLTIYCNKRNDLDEDGIRWLRRFYDGGKNKAEAIVDYGSTLIDLGNEIRKGHYDVLHIQSFKKASAEMQLYYLMRKYYKKLVMTVHNVLPHEPAPGDMDLYGRFYKACDFLIVHNDASKKELQDKFGISDEKIAVIPRGLYTTYDTQHSISGGTHARKNFVCFGRIRPYKGVDILLRAISLMDPGDRAKCRFIIKGEQYPKLDPTDYPALIREYGIEDCVEFSSSRVPEDEIPELIGSADYLIFPYRKIYGSGVLLMAYTYQIPVVASDVPTFIEGTDNGKAGILFRSEDAAALRDAIIEALDKTPEELEAYRSAIRGIVNERHNWKTTARQTAAAYRRILTETTAFHGSSAGDAVRAADRKACDGTASAVNDIDSFLQMIADARYDGFLEAGHAAPGCNGPYGCPDTPVRNTAHWLITYSYLWKTTKDEKYRDIALRFADYLLDMQGRSKTGAIACISEEWPDQLNGMIGQAWVIEALVYAYETFEDNNYLDCAVRIFHSQRFDEKTGLWKKVEPDGTEAGFDQTLNHQIWFAIAGLLILKHREYREIRRQVDRHLERVYNEYFGIHSNGLIRHFGAMKWPRAEFMYLYLKQYVKYAGLKLDIFDTEFVDLITQEEGYHLFELYGYAVIACLRDYYPLLVKPDFRKALDYARDTDALNKRLGTDSPEAMNKYAYGYNSPAFEIPLIDLMLNDAPDDELQNDKIRKLLELQKELTYNPETGRMDRNNSDPETLEARLYEYVRYCDLIRSNTEKK